MGYRSVTNIFVGTLDDVPDGVSYRRVVDVAGGQITPGSISNYAVLSQHIAGSQVGPIHTVGWSGVINAYNGAFTIINGLVVGDGSGSSSGSSWPEEVSGSGGGGDSSGSEDSSGSGEGSGV